MKTIVPSMLQFLTKAVGAATLNGEAPPAPMPNRVARRAAKFGRDAYTWRERYARRLQARLTRGSRGAARKASRWAVACARVA